MTRHNRGPRNIPNLQHPNSPLGNSPYRNPLRQTAKDITALCDKCRTILKTNAYRLRPIIGNDEMNALLILTLLPHVSEHIIRMSRDASRLLGKNAELQDWNDRLSKENMAQSELLDAAARDLDAQALELQRTEQELQQAKADRYRAVQTVTHLKRRKSEPPFPSATKSCLQTWLEGKIGKKEEGPFVASLEEGLRILQEVYPREVLVLDSAFDSAREASDFSLPTKAFFLMLRLVTQYREAMLQGGGDSVAKKIFSDSEFAGNECDKVKDTLRTFDGYYMPGHLKIGNGAGTANGWRCHFLFDPETGRIIIGHCGKHLDFN